ncbi:MAG TPA: hypothetical protein VGM06_23695 [Polyangiaceae bacterium]|jgi:hypothetical protein
MKPTTVRRDGRAKAVGMATLVVALGAVALGAGPSRADADAPFRAEAFIAGLDFDRAREELASADPQDPRVVLARARLAINELDCDGAAVLLADADVQKADEGGQLGDMARGCQRVTAALAVDRDEARGIEVRWQDEHDRALAPRLFDTVAEARAALTRDLGVDWPKPTRIVVVRDLLSLSAMTGLPYESAQTTGTLAVAKWGRVTMLSPRASRHGYAWRDTVAHELTHLAVTRATRDRAPLWLQEGIAKRQETRWRDPGPFDDRPPPDAVVLEGERRKLDLPLDKLGPSIAMLPSAEQAMVAYAEVTSFVRFYADSQGSSALPKLLAECRVAKDADAALLAASGADLKGWDVRWRAAVNAADARVREAAKSAMGPDAQGGADEKDKWGDVRDRSRLADLLLSRAHPAEALHELDALDVRGGAGSLLAGDASLRWMRARALEGAGRRAEGEPLVADAKDVVASYAPWWALRGRWFRVAGDEAAAVLSFEASLAEDPFEPEAACETIDAGRPADAEKGPLCDAARAASGPPFGQD